MIKVVSFNTLVNAYVAIIASPLEDLILVAPRVIKLALLSANFFNSSLASIVYGLLIEIVSPSNIDLSGSYKNLHEFGFYDSTDYITILVGIPTFSI